MDCSDSSFSSIESNDRAESHVCDYDLLCWPVNIELRERSRILSFSIPVKSGIYKDLINSPNW